MATSQRLTLQVAKGKKDAGLEGRSKTVIADKYEKAKNDYKLSHETWKNLFEELEKHTADFNDRRKMWKSKLRTNANIISSKFDMYLQRKGFAGTVKFDHKNHTLHLACQTDSGNDASRVSDVRQLSGGERSYTTLCLLLALGHVVSGKIHIN